LQSLQARMIFSRGIALLFQEGRGMRTEEAYSSVLGPRSSFI
jgi:hypothetical protein